MEIKGFTYGYSAKKGMYNCEKGIESQNELMKTGINWVCLAFPVNQKTYSSTEIYFDYRYNMPDLEIIDTINRFHEKNIKVCLKPMINCSDGIWRALIDFPDANMMEEDYYWKQWFEFYQAFLEHYAQIAEFTKCEMFCLGCEMLGTERKEDYWRQTIAKVRKIYSGPLVYNTNHGKEEVAQWYDAIDYIGTSAYYPVGGESRSYDEMCKNWMTVRRRLDELAKKNDKQYIFMEIGCRSVEQASVHPWDFTEDLPFNEQEQADFYKSCYDIFLPSPYFAGVFWWDWPTKLYNKDKAKEDKGFCIYGKAAEQVVREYNLKFNRQILKRNN